MALTPTLAVLDDGLDEVRARPDTARKCWYLGGAAVHGRLGAEAAEAGVTVLAGTDSRPHGRIADVIRALAAAGVPRTIAQLDAPRAIVLRRALVT